MMRMKLRRMRSCMVCVVVALEIAFAGYSYAQNVPVVLSKDAIIFIDVLVADSIPARFILDTGAGIHVVSHSLLNRTSRTPRGRFTGFRHNGERIDLDVFQLPSLSIACIVQEKPIVAVWHVLDSLKIDGILSLKFFEHNPFTLNLQDSTLTFESEATLVSMTGHAPLKIHDDRGMALDVFADFRMGDSLKLECILDTGSPSSVFDVRFLGSVGIDTTSSAVRKRIRRRLTGGVETEYSATVGSITLWDAPAVGVVDNRVTFKERLIYDGLIGIDFFRNKKVTFDIPNGRLLIRNDWN